MDEAENILEILEESSTLDQAEFGLGPHVVSRARRWGLWDGWQNRPYSEAGLVQFNWSDEKKNKEFDAYMKGYQEGQVITDLVAKAASA